MENGSRSPGAPREAAPKPRGSGAARGGSPKVRIGLWLGLLLFFAVLLLDLEPGNPAITRITAVAALMATWWITEAIPIPATSLLPLVLFPILGILAAEEVAPIYMNSNIFLFMGGFILALAIEKWGLHRRIALRIIGILGVRPRRLVLGFMIATAFLSMWISNTATAMLMFP
ncbi:MAG: SLC13 family permease, partial [Candidatus Eisenbacteria bacterium]